MEERATRLNAFITRTFVGSVLKDRHEGLLYYQVPLMLPILAHAAAEPAPVLGALKHYWTRRRDVQRAGSLQNVDVK